ncbi:protein cornichon homolog 4-like [Durio zibethinus]|uniref:Protein cornichon homolog 4-like n=1 Tax=Durio zibethinus TaxID=66656 RepID=A0A6P6AY25_DURZI|nr:protein cornichon homolog 4-like [Durio zibethinus]
MGNLFGWLVTFFLLITLLAIISYQLMCFADLEFDYINPYDSAARINMVVMPEFVIQAVFCLVSLMTGHSFMCFLSLPYLYYNFRSYKRRRHLIDVAEIYNQLNWEKKQRLMKLGYLIILLVIFIFWLLWTVGNDDY